MEFHACFDNSGAEAVQNDYLSQLVLPAALRRGTVELMYDYKPGTPLPDRLADAIGTVNIDEWVASWVPPNFSGRIVCDSEKWWPQQSLNAAVEHNAVAAAFPTYTWGEAMGRFMSEVNAVVRRRHPLSPLGWYGRPDWHPDQLASFTERHKWEAVRDCFMLAQHDFVSVATYAN